jgi:hypothetical protein
MSYTSIRKHFRTRVIDLSGLNTSMSSEVGCIAVEDQAIFSRRYIDRIFRE